MNELRINKLLVDTNYITANIFGETITRLYPRKNSVYSETKDTFLIKTTFGGILTIIKKDVDLGLWLDSKGLAFTYTSLTTFLRSNTAV